MLNQRQLVRAENHSNTAARFLLLPLGVLHVELPPPRPPVPPPVTVFQSPVNTLDSAEPLSSPGHPH